jgi:hypothetical protein
VKCRMYAGLEDRKSRKVSFHPRFVDVDQLLELHTNLTFVQSRLLEILQVQLGNAEVREMQQQAVQRHWSEFTMSLEESFNSISTNTTNLMKELFMGLLRLQSLTRESAKYVSEELQTLETDVRIIRGDLQRAHDDIDDVGNAGVAKIDRLAEMTQQRLSMVRTPTSQVNKIQYVLDGLYADDIIPISERLGHINHEMVASLHLLTIDIFAQYHSDTRSSSQRIS